MMNPTKENGKWNKMKGELIMKYASLTENDQMFNEGVKQQMMGNEQIRLGGTEEELQKIIEALD
jgi:uncharacterized protein YjbJ (UPF0337 family)